MYCLIPLSILTLCPIVIMYILSVHIYWLGHVCPMPMDTLVDLHVCHKIFTCTVQLCRKLATNHSDIKFRPWKINCLFPRQNFWKKAWGLFIFFFLPLPKTHEKRTFPRQFSFLGAWGMSHFTLGLWHFIFYLKKKNLFKK